MKRAFETKQKVFFIIFRGFSIKQITIFGGRLEYNFKRKISSNK